MKKFLVSAGAVALGTLAVKTNGAGAVAAASKPWDVSLSVRGFYDDNPSLTPNGPAKRSSFGVEAKPSIGVTLNGEQTSFGARYTYDERYYAKQSHSDQSHELNTWLIHAFSERYSVDVANTFTIAQEPALVDPGLGVTTRSKGDNIHNDGNLDFHAQVTRLLELVLGYRNEFFDYDQKNGTAAAPSYSGLLDRIEHYVNLDARWQLRRDTFAVFGYQYGVFDYTGGEPIGQLGATKLYSKIRDSRSQYGYAGLDHSFSRNLIGSARVGAQFINYYNSPGKKNNTSPYATASLQYNYRAGSSVQLGFEHHHNATDAFSILGTDITLDQESSVVYLSITHAFTPKFIGTLTGQYQNSQYNGGGLSSQSDDVFLFGASLEYHINRHLSADLGYNYDRVDSKIAGRKYDRNRVYLGMTASY